jgi:hypothetical protein
MTAFGRTTGSGARVPRSRIGADLPLLGWPSNEEDCMPCRPPSPWNLLVECCGEQCRQVFCRPAARVARLALFKAGVQRRLAVVCRVGSRTSRPLGSLRPYIIVVANYQYSNIMITDRASPAPTLLYRLRPLRDAVGSPVRVSRNSTSKYLIQMALSRTTSANSRAQKIIRPVFRLLQGSKCALV